jgi:RNase P/RNase MRP subunit p29
MATETTITPTFQIDKQDNVFTISKDGQSFHIEKRPETFFIDGDYFVSEAELQDILTEVRLIDALNE